MKKQQYTEVVAAMLAGYSNAEVADYVIKYHPAIFLQAVNFIEPSVRVYFDGIAITKEQQNIVKAWKRSFENGGDKVEAIKAIRFTVSPGENDPCPSLKYTKEYVEGTLEVW